MTKMEKFVAVSEILLNMGEVELGEFMKAEAERMSVKAATSNARAKAKAMEAHTVEEDMLLAIFPSGKVTASTVGAAAGISTSKAVAVLKRLVAKGYVANTRDKKTSLFEKL